MRSEQACGCRNGSAGTHILGRRVGCAVSTKGKPSSACWASADALLPAAAASPSKSDGATWRGANSISGSAPGSC